MELTLQKIYFPLAYAMVDGKSENKPILLRNWYTANVKLKTLRIIDSHIHAIKNGTFNKTQFDELELLEFLRVPLVRLYTDSLLGLQNLKCLHMNGMRLFRVGQHFLKPLRALQSLSIVNCGQNQINLKRFFGDGDYDGLQWMNIQYCNLQNISNDTFHGMSVLKELQLVQNEINELKPATFDGVIRTLTQLILDLNKLTTLPMGIFDRFRNKDITISLTGNPWHCDCKLDHLRQFIVEHPSVKFGAIVCQTPSNMKGTILTDHSSLCNATPASTNNKRRPVEKETFIPTISKPLSSMTKPQLETDPITSKINFNLQCTFDKNITLTTPSTDHNPFLHAKAAQQYVEDISLSSGFDLLEFDQSESNGVKCNFVTKNSGSTQLQIKRTLKPLHLHRFCLIKKKSNTISPLDCASFHSNSVEHHDDPWLSMDDKTTAICVCAVFMVLAPIVGGLIAVAIAKYFQRKHRPLTTRVNLQELFPNHKIIEIDDRLK